MSREEAIKELTELLPEEFLSEYADAIKMGIEALSSLEKPKMGHWEWNQYDSNPNIGNWHCSECRTIIPDMPEKTDNTPIYKWCPMCGCKMQEVKE